MLPPRGGPGDEDKKTRRKNIEPRALNGAKERVNARPYAPPVSTRVTVTDE